MVGLSNKKYKPGDRLDAQGNLNIEKEIVKYILELQVHHRDKVITTLEGME